MNDPAQIWADPRFVYTVATVSVALLLAAIWLFHRRRRHGRQAGVICLLLSVGFHIALVFLVPLLPSTPGGISVVDEQSDEIGVDSVALSNYDPNWLPSEAAGESESMLVPLPVANPSGLMQNQPDLAESQPPSISAPTDKTDTEGTDASDTDPSSTAASNSDSNSNTVQSDLAADEIDRGSPTKNGDQIQNDLQPELEESKNESLTRETDPVQSVPESMVPESMVPESLVARPPSQATLSIPEIAYDLDSMLEDAFARNPSSVSGSPGMVNRDDPESVNAKAKTTTLGVEDPAGVSASVTTSTSGGVQDDFANRSGPAKQQALLQSGGDAATEAAVQAALRFLVANQRSDGAWDPRATGAGVERAPLGTARGNAGSTAETAITGLALLTLMGAGQTHQHGEYSDNIYRGLAYLIRNQKPNGSLVGNASVYEATYCHGMAALAICEAAAITQDPSAVHSARRAIAYTQQLQHPSTGGWRYTAGDPGDLSQLGWQAMVLDAGQRAGIQLDRRAIPGVQRFLRSVRTGSRGGLAGYRAGEAPSRTMTAEALATRLLIGQSVPEDEIAEAERYLLQQPPGIGQDNYYYWYYATLALHQLQDDAWQRWNQSLKTRLLTTQQSDGSWSTATVWGGYGGTAYTTSMAALCLETYYRHVIRNTKDRVATQDDATIGR